MMLTDLSLRLRVFLFFGLLALGGAAAVGLSLYVGYGRAMASDMANGFVFAGILAVLLIVGLVVGVWMLFDENVAKPIEKLAAEMRARAHAGVDRDMDLSAARYLGDLAPAADAVTRKLTGDAMDTAQAIARETNRLNGEKARLTALLTDIPVAVLLVNDAGQIVLYDGQAAEVLSQIHVPRLNASIYDYFLKHGLEEAAKQVRKTGRETRLTAHSVDGRQSYDARMKPMDGGGYMLIIDDSTAEISPDAARPLIYDFDLMNPQAAARVEDRPLRDLVFSVFDSETTGLLPHKDEVVQLGAVRIVGGRIVPGELMDELVDPGIPIPPGSTRVHKVTDAMVAGKPDIITVSKRFHAFSRDAVIVAHNAPFDMAFLRRHAPRAELKWDHPILDTVLLSAVIFGASEPHTLDALCDRLDVTIPVHLRHTALGDAQATAEVLVKLLPMLEARGLHTFGDVIAETRKHGRLLEDLN